MTLLWRWLPVLVWAGCIFAFSANPDPYSVLPTALENQFDLIGAFTHAAEYALLAFLVIRALSWDQPLRWHWVGGSLALAALYSLSDEIHQLFVPGRAFQLLDLSFDWLGSLVGVGIFVLTWKKRSS